LSQDSTLSNHLTETHHYKIITNSFSSLIAMNVVSYHKSSLIETNLCEMTIALSSSLSAMKTFFIAVFISSRDEKERPLLILSLTACFSVVLFCSEVHNGIGFGHHLHCIGLHVMSESLNGKDKQ